LTLTFNLVTQKSPQNVYFGPSMRTVDRRVLELLIGKGFRTISWCYLVLQRGA